MNSYNIAIPQSSFQIYLVAPKTQLLFSGKTAYRLPFEEERRLYSAWKDSIQISRKSNFKGSSIEKHHTSLIKAVATVEPKCLVSCEDGHRHDHNLQFGSHSDSFMFQSSKDDSPEADDKERLRRMKISEANKGNVPWNKGRKHSAETLRRIRERTKIAMQDPKVKMKLVNFGHAQSEETRIKIGLGVREGWQRRRIRLMVQECCYSEWQNMIADASRKGYAGEDELQWDSYKILGEQLKVEWLESIKNRKTVPRPKGSKRATKSLEQRRKISEAISAKWTDPGYRGRVCAAMAKHHGTPTGAGRKRRRKPTSETPSAEAINIEAKNIKKATSRKTGNATPPYRDPMASSKLEMIKTIRGQRVALEIRKREAIERAKLLIAEAEKAAKALEVAALKSPLAQASLLETKKLIAEAKWSIESIEGGQLTLKGSRNDVVSVSGGPLNHFQTGPETPNTDTFLNEQLVNGSHPISESIYKDLNFDKLTLQNAPLSMTRSAENSPGIVVHSHISPPLQPNNVRKQSDAAGIQVGLSEVNGSIRYENPPHGREEEGTSQMRKGISSRTSAAKTRKKWVRGRLVEVED